MPIKKSAKKYMRVSAKNNLRNRESLGVIRNAIKKTREAAKSGQVDEAKKWFAAAAKSLDKGINKGVVKKNTAARSKSRLNALVKAIVKK